MLRQKFLSPEIAIPAIKPIFPGAVFPEGTFDNNFTLSGFDAAAKLKQKRFFILAGKVKYLKQALTEKNNATQALQVKIKTKSLLKFLKLMINLHL